MNVTTAYQNTRLEGTVELERVILIHFANSRKPLEA
jgi:hypothetical protein